MLLFIYGADIYRAREKVNVIKQKYRERYPEAFQLREIDWGERPDLETLKVLTQTSGFFGEQKLVIVKDFFAAPTGVLEEAQKYFKESDIKNQKETTLLLWDRPEQKKATGGKSEKPKNVLAWLKRNALCEEFTALKGAEFTQWLKDEIARRKLKLASSDITALSRAFESDTWAITLELDKIEAGHPLIITRKPSTDVFDLVRALWRHDDKKALQTLELLLDGGANEFYILAMMAYAARKSLERAQGAELERLKRLHQKIASADLKMKSSDTDPQFILELLTLQLAGA